MKKVKKIIFFSTVILAILFSTFGCSSQTTEKTIAEYKGGEITATEFNVYLGIIQFFDSQVTEMLGQKEIKEKILKEYIAEEYLLTQARDTKSHQKEADDLLQIIKDQKIQQLGSEEKYLEQLKALKISDEDISGYINRYFTIQSYFVEKKYEENKEEFTIATVSHILILINEERTDEQAKKRAEEVLAKLETGEKFSDLAKEYSDDPGSKNEGGTYEDAPVALWVPEFKEAALTLPLNTISDLVKTDYGYHIIKVNDRHVPEIGEIPEDQINQVFSVSYNQFITTELDEIIISIDL